MCHGDNGDGADERLDVDREMTEAGNQLSVLKSWNIQRKEEKRRRQCRRTSFDALTRYHIFINIRAKRPRPTKGSDDSEHFFFSVTFAGTGKPKKFL